MTITAPERVAEASGRRPSRYGPWLGGLSAAAVLAGTAHALLAYDTPAAQAGVFGVYVVLGLMIPGTLIWRACSPIRCVLAVDLAAGTAVGYAAEVLAYIVARALDAPRWFLLWPVVTMVIFLTVPRLRRHWRGGPERMPATAAWSLSGLVTIAVVWAATLFYRTHGLSWPANGSPYIDMPYHLSLIGELRHHMPPEVPQVIGEPLSYHWFVYADLAATTWATGIEPETLLYRLAILPMGLAVMVLIAGLARLISGSWWAGVGAVLLTAFVGSPPLYSWRTTPLPSGSPAAVSWLSPTHTFGALLFGALVLVVAGILTTRSVRPATMILVVGLLMVVAGAKSTYIPLLVAGLALLLVFGRGLRRTASLLLVPALAVLAFAQVVLFGGKTQGTAVQPGATGVKLLASFVPPDQQVDLGMLPAVFCLALVIGWIAAFAGVTGLWRARGACEGAVVILCAGIGLGGVGGVLLLGHPSLSQFYFLRGAWPWLAVIAAVGLWAALREAPPRVRPVLVVAGAAAGTAAALMIGGDGAAEPDLTLGVSGMVWPLLGPPLILAGLVMAAVLILHRVTGGPAVILLAVTALCVTGTVDSLVQAEARRPVAEQIPEIPEGAAPAAHWLRANTGPDEVVATNAHCRGAGLKRCENRHFWISAYTERRMLVEGWAYTATNIGQVVGSADDKYTQFPFWDVKRQAVNDAVFRDPSRAAIRRLVEEYGVRWLFVDERDRRLNPRVGEFAALRYRSGWCAVYQIIPWAVNPTVFSPVV
ncbi:hypothetical protein [Streptosporangium sp. KLBMP 9127]|nr:hypothetical protein [Streptosporangium sp. KLBMP 9127]